MRYHFELLTVKRIYSVILRKSFAVLCKEDTQSMQGSGSRIVISVNVIHGQFNRAKFVVIVSRDQSSKRTAWKVSLQNLAELVNELFDHKRPTWTICFWPENQFFILRSARYSCHFWGSSGQNRTTTTWRSRVRVFPPPVIIYPNCLPSMDH